MKLITYKPNTFLSLISATPSIALNSEGIFTVISVNNFNPSLERIFSVVQLSLQKGVGFFSLKNTKAYISENIQRFILVGWIDRP